MGQPKNQKKYNLLLLLFRVRESRIDTPLTDRESGIETHLTDREKATELKSPYKFLTCNNVFSDKISTSIAKYS